MVGGRVSQQRSRIKYPSGNGPPNPVLAVFRVNSAGGVGIVGGTKGFRRAFSGNSYPHKIRCVSCQTDKFNIKGW